MKQKIIVIFLLCELIIFLIPVSAQQTKEKFIKEIDYLFYLPKEYSADTGKKWPLLVFLHGSGEQGTDLDKIKVHGLPKLIDKGQEFDFIVVSPQAQHGWNSDFLYEMILDVKSKYRVDDDRIYLTGLSMGGFGTWDLAMKHPELFAAIAPVCGGGNTNDAWKLRYMPVWCFHGAKDPVVPVKFSVDMIKAVKNMNQDVNFTVYPDKYHNCWDTTYNNPQLFEWFLKHRKFKYTIIEPNRNLWKYFTGDYIRPEGDTISVYIDNEKLMLRINNQNKLELKAASDSVFFINQNYPADIRFASDKKKQIDRMIYMGEEKSEAIKIRKKRK
jgi:predicted esterase